MPLGRKAVKQTLILLALALVLAGCADTKPEPTVAPEPSTDDMVIRGIVQTADLAPIVTANVTVMPLNLTETTAPDGSFRFPPLPLAVYDIAVTADGYLPRTVSVTPGQNNSILITLEPSAVAPTQDLQRYKGHLQCAAEYIIIVGACDRVSTEFGGPSLVDAEGIFEHDVQAGWQTIVVDVVFESGAASTYDGLRVTVKGGDDADALNEYAQYGRFHDSTAYTFRLEPGQTYNDGNAPVPGNATTFLFDVFAQGHGYHAVCDPSGGSCFLGVGAGVDVQFELVVTTFYHEGAPEGFTQR